MEIKKILWPTDISRNAEKALPYLEALSQKFQAEIHVLYVIEDIARHEPWYGEFNPSHIKEITDWEEKKAGEHLDHICERFLDGCPHFSRETAVGDPAEEILKIVRKGEIDMVVMTSRGRKSRFSTGSVAEKVFRHSPVPVVIIPVEELEKQ
jgi:nucleotide-binding universal stress UspA family protein